ncbi:hypothetical protein J6590_063311 [Homalodisca vitripennis]|nr:hypothetical protein J6590_063311 [Homalodisca vitripennis]
MLDFTLMSLNWCIITVFSVVKAAYADINKQILRAALDRSNSRTISLGEVNSLLENYWSAGEL